MSNIAISYENTISKNFEFWLDFLKYLRIEGHLIYVIGHKWRESLSDSLEYNGFLLEHHYDVLIPLIEFLKRQGRDIIYSEFFDTWRCRQSIIWWSSKALACNINHCALMLDSDIRYAAFFRNIATRFVDTSDDEVMAHFKTTLTKIKEENEWFEDYDSEFNVSMM
jgi:hypothetical protein